MAKEEPNFGLRLTQRNVKFIERTPQKLVQKPDGGPYSVVICL